MLELRPRATVGNSQTRVVFENPQPRRLLLALVLLVVALGVVVMKDQLRFGSEQSDLDLEASEPAATKTAAVPTTANPAKSATALNPKRRIPAAKTSTEPKPADVPAVATTRTALPPLDIEVVAGDTHSQIHPGGNNTKIESTHPESAAATPVQSASTIAAATNAAEHEQMSIEAVRPRASYPLLAQHMNVQGSVVLQAIISSDGIIQTLHVLSGPAILSAAAQQAVREWRFKPVVENGQPVETKAKITVNFTIKVADGSGTTLAESRAARSQVLSR